MERGAIQIFANWLPPLLIVIAMFWVLRNSAKRSRNNFEQVKKINEDLLDLNRRMLIALEDIKALLKDRNP
ncbi:hypothetical protein [Oharaeibacter diazotrophicus]|uniref:Uncharacterized protein n=1 Tax=Oharaeibacter diazotrophicus TaxID=1920512 RepID=A0A4V3CVC7_9HYPH|nr:hypothetical protein [Oharaeibacter diazotrophicus]TDP81978.1 hypothetical protein EDD54_4239 [Oharaeibacter diazotrophicus]BBE73610.1 hypothetical protein OHA_1_03224 [Pleomorphomonas sp. SM30]